jgi:microcystin-dependent protein
MLSIPESTAPAPGRRNWLKGLGALLTGGLLLGKNRAAAAPAEVFSTTGGQPIFLGEIMMISWNFPPRGFAFCNGQLLPINQNQALFALLGTAYGGDGRTTFALPDLRGRIPVGGGSFDYTLGQRAGAEAHTLTLAQLPGHTHGLKASVERGTTERSGTAGTSPVHNYLADSGGGAPQYGSNSNAAMATTDAGGATVNTTTFVGGSQAHNNLQPFGCIHFVIAISGAVFPSPNP